MSPIGVSVSVRIYLRQRLFNPPRTTPSSSLPSLEGPPTEARNVISCATHISPERKLLKVPPATPSSSARHFAWPRSSAAPTDTSRRRRHDYLALPRSPRKPFLGRPPARALPRRLCLGLLMASSRMPSPISCHVGRGDHVPQRGRKACNLPFGRFIRVISRLHNGRLHDT